MAAAMFSFNNRFLFSPSLLLLLAILPSVSHAITNHRFSIQETTIADIRVAFNKRTLSSRQLVEFYIEAIRKLNPTLHGVIEINPDALNQADKADRDRDHEAQSNNTSTLPDLHGVPVLLKDSIATKDKLNTTAGSYALLGSVVPRDAGVVKKLREGGAVILGKASLSEWAGFRTLSAPAGWSARGGQGKNPYVLSASPCGSSSGSAISVAANLVTVSLGTETDGSILCPASQNSVVGIKPTVGLTSRGGVVPISLRQDTIGPICRTVSDAVYLLDAIVGYDPRDKATEKALEYIPQGGYKQFLKLNSLTGKRLGVVRKPFLDLLDDPFIVQALDHHIETLRQKGAIVIDNLEIHNIESIMNSTQSGEYAALLAEFKTFLNAYLQELAESPVRSLADVIAFNDLFQDLEKTNQFGQDTFLAAEATNGIGKMEKTARRNLAELSRNGIEKLMIENKIDAVVSPGSYVSPVLAIGGYPGINVPAGYDSQGVPFGISFGGLKFTEPKLIEIAYGFEQATKIRRPPKFGA